METIYGFTMQRATQRQRAARKADVRARRSARWTQANKNRISPVLRGLGRARTGFPNSIVTKLRYSDTFEGTGTAGARFLNVFAANGIFDPDLSGGGHQPLYHDNYFNLYNHYEVIASKITVTFCAKATNTIPMVCGIVVDDDSSISSQVTTLMEQSGNTAVVDTDGRNVATLTSNYNGRTYLADSSQLGRTTFGTNPTELICFGVWAATCDGATNGTVSVVVHVDYTVRCSELKTQTQN